MYIMQAKDFVDVERNTDKLNEVFTVRNVSKVSYLLLLSWHKILTANTASVVVYLILLRFMMKNDEETVQRFMKVKEANRTVMEILAENESIITMDVMLGSTRHAFRS